MEDRQSDFSGLSVERSTGQTLGADGFRPFVECQVAGDN